MTIFFTDGGHMDCGHIEFYGTQLFVDEYRIVDLSSVDYIEG